MKLHVVTGLPRSGSTLLCNILNQNPKFWSTSTSALSNLLSVVSHTLANSPEVKGLLQCNREQTEHRMKAAAQAFVKEWHSIHDREIVFDKSRSWTHNSLLLNSLYPDAKMLVTVRDLRSVFGSCEKQHRKNPILDEAKDLNSKTLYSRADTMFSPDGLIGGPIVGIQDILNRKVDVFFVKYEDFAADPTLIMSRVYGYLGEENFEHDFENVENTAKDPDYLYMHKYPHKGEGKVAMVDKDEWKTYFSQDIADIIMQRFKDFNTYFGYR